MALRFVDGFDHYSVGFIGRKYTSAQNLSAFVTGRFGGSALRMAPSSSTKDAIRVLDAQATWISGFAWKVDESPPNANYEFFRWLQGATVHCSLRHNTNGDVDFIRGGGIATLGTVLTGVVPNTWYYLELKVTISDTGSAIVNLNGTEVLNLPVADTSNGGGTTADRFQLLTIASSGAPNTHIDDLYICDATGGVNNNFLGDCRVETLFPNGNGNSSQFDGSDGNSTDNYLLVDETPPDDDTTYVESSDVSDKDTYAYSNLVSTSGLVQGIQINPMARKTDAGLRTYVTVARHSATEEDGPVVTLGANYNDDFDPRDTKPGGGSWSIANINAAEFGIKVNS